MLGVESQIISDGQMSASSARSSLSTAKHGRANGRKVSNVDGMPDSDGGWIPNSFNHDQYLQIDLGTKMKVTAVETQGADGHSYWVTSYQVQFSEDGSSFSTLQQVKCTKEILTDGVHHIRDADILYLRPNSTRENKHRIGLDWTFFRTKKVENT